jgi:hypothetical protein
VFAPNSAPPAGSADVLFSFPGFTIAELSRKPPKAFRDVPSPVVPIVRPRSLEVTVGDVEPNEAVVEASILKQEGI